MATIFRRMKTGDKPGHPTGSWVAEIRKVGYKPIKKSFRLKAAAEKWATDTESKMNNDVDVSLSQKKMTLEAAIDRYLAEITPFKKGAARGIENETITLSQVKTLPLVKKRITQIRKADIESVISMWRKRGNAKTTINRKLTTLSDVFNIVEEKWDYEGMANPCSGKREDLEPEEGQRSRTFKNNEYNDLIVALDCCLNPYIKQVTLFVIETGLRRREVLELAWKNVHIDNRYIFVTPETSKTRTGRHIPLSPTAINILKATKLLTSEQSERVFPITEKAFEEAWKKTVKRAKLVDFQFRDLRHVAITNLSKVYPRMQDLAKISGHTKLETLLIYYEEDIHDQVQQMDAFYTNKNENIPE